MPWSIPWWSIIERRCVSYGRHWKPRRRHRREPTVVGYGDRMSLLPKKKDKRNCCHTPLTSTLFFSSFQSNRHWRWGGLVYSSICCLWWWWWLLLMMMVVIVVVVARCFRVATTWTENSSSILSLTFQSDFNLLEVVDCWFVHLL